MCLIIFKPQNVTFNLDHIKNALHFNSDGMGLSIRTDKGLHVYRGVTLEDIEENLEFFKGYEVVLHLRYGTSGQATIKQCHPFLIGKKTTQDDYEVKNDDSILFHNGIMFNAKNDYSDTQIVARGLKNLSGLDKYLRGNRFLVQNKDENIFLGQWHEVEGMQYSNLSYHQDYYSTSYVSSWDDLKDVLDEKEYLTELCPFCDSDHTEMIDLTTMTYGCYDCDNTFILDDYYEYGYLWERMEDDLEDELLDEKINGNRLRIA